MRGIDCVQYVCNNYGTNGTGGCSAHTIEARDLFDAVLADIRHYARLAVEGDEKRVRQLQQQLSSIGATEQKALEREKRKLSKRLGELDKLFSALYEDKVMERITERNFDMVSRKYETEQAQLSGRIEEINASLAEKETSDNEDVVLGRTVSLPELSVLGFGIAIPGVEQQNAKKPYIVLSRNGADYPIDMGPSSAGNARRVVNFLKRFHELPKRIAEQRDECLREIERIKELSRETNPYLDDMRSLEEEITRIRAKIT